MFRSDGSMLFVLLLSPPGSGAAGGSQMPRPGGPTTG
jgi:hypothetical protein